MFRVGAFGDGGYLVPDDLKGISQCFSPGVSRQASFELDLAKHGISSLLADASVDGPPHAIPGAVFIKKHLSAEGSDNATITLNDWVDEFASDDASDMLLQMDIEGAEYPVMATADPDILKRFRIVVIELHRIPAIVSKPAFFRRAKPLLDSLAANYVCVHLHPNNVSGTVNVGGIDFPRVVEATFLRKDRIKTQTPATDFPHPLDVAHSLKKSKLSLPQEWISD